MAESSAETIRLRREQQRQREEDQQRKHDLKVRDFLFQRQVDQQKMAHEQEKQAFSQQSRQAQMQMDAQLGQAQLQVQQELKGRAMAAKQQELAAKEQQGQQQAAEQQMQEPILEPPQQIDGTRTDIDPMRNVGPQQLSVPQQGGGAPSPYGGPLAPYIEEQAVRQGIQRNRFGGVPITETTTTRTPNVLTADGAVRERIAQAREDAAISKIEGTTLGDRLFLLKPNERQVEMKGALESLMQEYPPQTAIAIYQKAQSRITALEVEQRKAELTGDRAMERGERLRGISDANARARQALGFSESDAREARRQKEAAAEPENQMRDRKAKILLDIANGKQPSAEDRAFLDELQRTSFEDKLMRSVTDQDAAPPSQQTPPPPNSTMRFNPATGEFEPVP